MRKLVIGILGYWVIGATCLASGEEERYDLGKIIVTATKTQSYQTEIGSSTTVINGDDIRKTGKKTVGEVLRDVPGVTVMQTSPFGGLIDIYIRGSKPGHTLVMVDGVELNDPMVTDRSFDFANLTVDNIERIEVVRGSQSTLYGSDAMGGIINIITKKGKGKPKLEISTEGGAHNTFRESLGLSGSTQNSNYSFFVSRLESNGISRARDGSEKDGYKNTTISSRLGYDIFDDAVLTLILRFTDAETDIDDGAYDDDPNYISWNRSFVSKLEFDQKINSWWNYNLSFSYSNTRREYRDDPDTVDTTDNTHNWFEGDNKKFEWQHNFFPVDWATITAGFEYEKEKGFSDGRASWDRFDRKTIDNKGFYLQNQFKLWNSLFITSGLRVDNHELFGTETTYKLSTAYLIPQTRTRLKANWGTGFKAPSLYQLYSSYGSTDLRPDKSKSYDFGFEQNLLDGKVSLGIIYFYNNFENMVDFDMNTFKYKNIDNAKTKGIENEITFKPIENMTISFTYTYLDTEDKDTGKKLVRRPENQVGFNINWSFLKKGSLNLITNYVGHRWDDAANTRKTKPYTRVNLFASYDFTKNFQIFGRIENLFDRNYEEVRGYATQGQSFYTGVKLTF